MPDNAHCHSLGHGGAASLAVEGDLSTVLDDFVDQCSASNLCLLQNHLFAVGQLVEFVKWAEHEWPKAVLSELKLKDLKLWSVIMDTDDRKAPVQVKKLCTVWTDVRRQGWCSP